MTTEERQFTEWRKAQARRMPELALRIFALRGTGYGGCGFHYELECELGTMLAQLNDYMTPGRWYHTEESTANRIILEVRLEELYQQVETIENKLKV